jgi:hypothetical protein
MTADRMLRNIAIEQDSFCVENYAWTATKAARVTCQFASSPRDKILLLLP